MNNADHIIILCKQKKNVPKKHTSTFGTLLAQQSKKS